ncbi:MAG: hypothetical protein AAF228_06120 [Pseudomonadota bacterium]
MDQGDGRYRPDLIGHLKEKFGQHRGEKPKELNQNSDTYTLIQQRAHRIKTKADKLYMKNYEKRVDAQKQKMWGVEHLTYEHPAPASAGRTNYDFRLTQAAQKIVYERHQLRIDRIERAKNNLLARLEQREKQQKTPTRQFDKARKQKPDRQKKRE